MINIKKGVTIDIIHDGITEMMFDKIPNHTPELIDCFEDDRMAELCYDFILQTKKHQAFSEEMVKNTSINFTEFNEEMTEAIQVIFIYQFSKYMINCRGEKTA